VYKVYPRSAAGNDSWDRISIYWIQKLALLLCEDLTGHRRIPGVLVAEFATFEGIIRIQWLAAVLIFREGDYYDSLRTYMVRAIYRDSVRKPDMMRR